MSDHRRPQAFHIDPAPKPDKAHRKPRAIAASKIKFAAETEGRDVVVLPPAPLPSARTLRWGSLLVSTIFCLFVMWAGLSITSLIEQLFQRSQYLGWIGLGLAALAGLAAVAIILREIWGLARLNRIEHVQADAARALNHDDDAAAKRVLAALKDIYRHRRDAAWGLKLWPGMKATLWTARIASGLPIATLSRSSMTRHIASSRAAAAASRCSLR